MNNEQIQSIIRSGLKILGALLVSKGYTAAGGTIENMINMPDVMGLLALGAGVLWSHWTHYTPGNAPDITKGASQLTKSGVLIACALSLGGAVRAQTNEVPNFLTQTYAWATAVNTNYDWGNVSYQADSGYKNTVQGNPAAFVSGSRNWGRLAVGAEFQVLAASATVQQAELRLGYAFYSNHDFKIESALYGGYDTLTSRAIIEPEIRATKLLTVNTYTFISYSLPFESAGKFNTVGQVRTGIGIAF